MGIVRWLLCHSLAIFILILLIFLYTIRAEISTPFVNFVGWTAQAPENELTTQANWSAEQQNNIGEINSRENKISDDSSQSEVVENSIAISGKQANDPWGDRRPDIVQNSESDKSVTNLETEPKLPAENDDPESSVLDKTVEKTNEKPSASAETGKESRSEISDNTASYLGEYNEYTAALDEARRLYWQGHSELASVAYERLILEYPKFPEAAEELGNVLLQQEDLDSATRAYSKAIQRHLNLHREREAISIISLISQYDPVIAEKLQKKFW